MPQLKWIPQIGGRTGPVYLAIADAIAGDIATGRLKAGMRLPTHRALAGALRVTIATITRAYAEAERRGLTEGTAGRGTFVRDRTHDSKPCLDDAPRAAGNIVDLSRSFPIDVPGVKAMIEQLLGEIGPARIAELVGPAPAFGLPAHREAGARWLSLRIGTADPARTAVLGGSQSAFLFAIAALALPGDTILAEALTHPNLRPVAKTLGVRLAGVEIDENGMIPEALAIACQRHRPKAVFVAPTFHSPTGSLMPYKRREMIVAVCRRFGVMIIEDDTNGLLDEQSVPLAALAPDNCIYISACAETTAGFVRLSYVHAPAAVMERSAGIASGPAALTSALSAELTTRLINSGGALRVAAWKRGVAEERRRLALDAFPTGDAVAHPGAPQLWLRLDRPWSGDGFSAAARQRGVCVAPASVFAIDPDAPKPDGVRIGLTAPEQGVDISEALSKLASLLRGEPGRAEATLAA
ncbi:MAG: aminotransferase class I/II-fold pyridoxal phosphate-dependent enzyme [Alphaproteobacteria bacterium]|nr:aminotransferase class I/II-fold pyridoxal phosphate-dependent enzyme [Alphaproteobacteria bacterium]